MTKREKAFKKDWILFMIWFKQEFLKGVGRGRGSKMVLYWGLETEPKHLDLQFFQLSLGEIETLSLFNKR